MGSEPAREDLGDELLKLYRSALPEVYGFVLARCGDAALAEDVTADAFMSAVSAVRSGAVDAVTTGWLIVVARRRLIDHWRRQELERRHLQLVPGVEEELVDPWTDQIDPAGTRAVLRELAPQHRAVLTLKYVDGLSVAEVAGFLGRSVHATEGLLQRARAALRHAYEEGAFDDA